MKKGLFCISVIFFLVLNTQILGQPGGIDKKEIRQRVESMPEEVKEEVSSLAEYLTQGMESDKEKAWAFYYYTANAIDYNFEKSNRITLNASREDILKDALEEGVGVCQHYSELFHALSKEAGIKSYVIAGYTRQNGKVISTSHSWNALMIDGQWRLFDPTWGGGYRQGNEYHHRFSERYFMVKPSEMFKSHMPYDPLYQFSNKVITHKDFARADFEPHLALFDDYKKALKRHSDLPEQVQLKEAMHRIKKVGKNQKTVEKYYNFLRQNYRVHLANEQVALHNKGVNLLNEAVNQFNSFVRILNKNRGSYPGGAEKAIKKLERVENKIKKAKSIINSVNPPVELENSVRKNRKVANQLLKRIDKEKKKLG
ncbi:MAG: hypothetical protein K9J27_03345 [Bacteroidales bacterium]|nr:hypothetical protein [Bacteroidales bacterium]MCF8332810.1 hypothetical protein [Bacteroidales bacterium]